MRNGNHTTMELRLAKDPEFKTVSGGLEVCKCNAAMSQGKPSAKEKPLWITIETWGYQAKCLASLKKGDTVLVDGSQKMDYWTDNEGNEKSKLVIVADLVGKKVWAPKAQEQGYNPTTNYPQQQNVQPGPPQVQPPAPSQQQFGQEYNNPNPTADSIPF